MIMILLIYIRLNIFIFYFLNALMESYRIKVQTRWFIFS